MSLSSATASEQSSAKARDSTADQSRDYKVHEPAFAVRLSRTTS